MSLPPDIAALVRRLAGENREKRGWQATAAHGTARAAILAALPLNEATGELYRRAAAEYEREVRR